MAGQTFNLGINISSNVSNALPGITNVSTGLNGMGAAANNAGTSLNRLAPISAQQATALQGLAAQARRGELSYVGLNGAITNAGRSLRAAPSQVGRATTSLTNLGRVASDAPFGFIAIQNNLDPLIQSFGLLFSSSKNSADAFRSLGAALIGPAGIGLAFSVISSTITSLIQKYGSLGNAIAVLNPFLANAAKAQGEYNIALAKGGAAAQEEITHVNLLYAATQDLNIPLEERRKIAAALIKQYPEQLAGQTEETILAGKATAAYKKLNEQLLATATIKAAEEQIVKQQQALFNLRLEARKLQDQLVELRKPGSGGIFDFGVDPEVLNRQINGVQNSLNKNTAEQNKLRERTTIIQEEQLKLLREFGAAAAGVSGAGIKTVQSILSDLSKALTDVDVRARLLGSSVADVAQEKLGPLNSALKDLLAAGLQPTSKEVQDVSAQIRRLVPITTSKDIKTVSDVIQELNKDLTGLDTAFAAAGGSLNKLSADKIDKISNALKALSEIGVRPGDDVFVQLQDQLKRFQDTINRIPVTIKIAPQIDTTAINTKQISNSVQSVAQAASDDFSRAFRSANDRALASLLESGAENATASIADGIGKAIAGGGISAVFSGFVDALAGLGEALGKQLIAQGIAIEAFKSSLSNLQGVGAIAAGAALIAASSAFRGIAKGGLASFATGGGVIGGPQLAMIGDNPGREEYVIPSEVLDKMGGAGGTLMHRFGVNEFIIWLDRGRRNA